MKCLYLNKAVELQCEGLNAIGRLPNLRSLKIYKLQNPCIDPLFHFQDGSLTKLENLSLAGSSCVSDICAYSIVLRCPQIQILSLAFVENVTDTGIETILKYCSSLLYFDIYEMKNITGSSFSCILQYAHNLQILIIEEFCETEKEENLNVLIRSNPNFHVHRVSTWKFGEIYTCGLLQ